MTNSESDERIGSDADEQTRQVLVTINAVIPEFSQARARDAAGHEYAITRKTEGVELESLREGQSLICTVTIKWPRVLRARLVQGGTQADVLPLGGKRE